MLCLFCHQWDKDLHGVYGAYMQKEGDVTVFCCSNMPQLCFILTVPFQPGHLLHMECVVTDVFAANILWLSVRVCHK